MEAGVVSGDNGEMGRSQVTVNEAESAVEVASSSRQPRVDPSEQASEHKIERAAMSSVVPHLGSGDGQLQPELQAAASAKHVRWMCFRRCHAGGVVVG
jgi:hypothetical protein